MSGESPSPERGDGLSDPVWLFYDICNLVICCFMINLQLEFFRISFLFVYFTVV